MQHTISLLVENKFGVLARISNLFSGKGYNLDSICVGETENPELSRMTIMTSGNDMVIEQIIKQLRKLINVTKVSAIADGSAVIRELALIKLYATASSRAEIKQLVDIFRAQIIDVSHESMTIEITGTEDKVDSLIEMLRPYGLKELSRTGRVAMVRGIVHTNGI